MVTKRANQLTCLEALKAEFCKLIFVEKWKRFDSEGKVDVEWWRTREWTNGAA